jgi:hypothetical protein
MNAGPDGPLWEIVGNPVMFQAAVGHTSAQGWAWKLSRISDSVPRQLDVVVEITNSSRRSLPSECGQAIHSAGRSAVEALLDMIDPPAKIAITDTGLENR